MCSSHKMTWDFSSTLVICSVPINVCEPVCWSATVVLEIWKLTPAAVWLLRHHCSLWALPCTQIMSTKVNKFSQILWKLFQKMFEHSLCVQKIITTCGNMYCYLQIWINGNFFGSFWASPFLGVSIGIKELE